jgi:hypothetical protein
MSCDNVQFGRHGATVRSAGRMCFLLAVAAGVAAAVGCAGKSDILTARLDDGRAVREIIPRDVPVALLIYDVRTCMTCGVALPLWQRLMRDSAVSVKLILVGELSEQDRRVLRLQRSSVAGTIARTSVSAESLPTEYLFANDVVHAKAVGPSSVKQRRLWAHLTPLVETARAARQ